MTDVEYVLNLTDISDEIPNAYDVDVCDLYRKISMDIVVDPFYSQPAVSAEDVFWTGVRDCSNIQDPYDPHDPNDRLHGLSAEDAIIVLNNLDKTNINNAASANSANSTASSADKIDKSTQTDTPPQFPKTAPLPKIVELPKAHASRENEMVSTNKIDFRQKQPEFLSPGFSWDIGNHACNFQKTQSKSLKKRASKKRMRSLEESMRLKIERLNIKQRLNIKPLALDETPPNETLGLSPSKFLHNIFDKVFEVPSGVFSGVASQNFFDDRTPRSPKMVPSKSIAKRITKRITKRIVKRITNRNTKHKGSAKRKLPVNVVRKLCTDTPADACLTCDEKHLRGKGRCVGDRCTGCEPLVGTCKRRRHTL